MARFLRSFALALVAFLVATAALTTLVDPYDYWGMPRVAGLNARRPSANTHLDAVKARQYARGPRWRTVVAGNSRVQVGFDPASRAWPATARPVYNYGLAGRTVPDLVRALDAATALRPPATLIVGIDLIDFRIDEAKWRAFRPAPDPPPPGLSARATELAEVSLSLTAAADALGALAVQRAADGGDISPAGYNALAEYRRLVRTEGHAALFEQRNRENYRNYRDGPQRVLWPGPGGSAAWMALDRLAATCRARGVRLIVFTYPYHSDILASVARAGLLPGLLDLRVALAGWGARRGVPVWDFTRVSPITTEPVPPPGDRTTNMAWYWEAGHFKPALGDRMIAAMTGSAVDGAIGAPLTPIGVVGANARLAADIASLGRRDPAQAARLAKSFAAVDRR